MLGQQRAVVVAQSSSSARRAFDVGEQEGQRACGKLAIASLLSPSFTSGRQMVSGSRDAWRRRR